MDTTKIVTNKPAMDAINAVVNKAINDAYHEGYSDAMGKGYENGIISVKHAIDWFHETYGTTYILVDSSSIEHLMNLYSDWKEKNNDKDN